MKEVQDSEKKGRIIRTKRRSGGAAGELEPTLGDEVRSNSGDVQEETMIVSSPLSLLSPHVSSPLSLLCLCFSGKIPRKGCVFGACLLCEEDRGQCQ